VPNLETNQIVQTCEITFDETQPRSQLVFGCAGDDKLGEEIFQEEEHEHGDDGDGGVVPPAEHVPTTSTTVVDGPSPTPTMTNQDQGEATVEGEVSGILPGYSCKEGRIVEDGLLVEFPCTPTRTRSV
jgi:hypothetical protein